MNDRDGDGDAKKFASPPRVVHSNTWHGPRLQFAAVPHIMGALLRLARPGLRSSRVPLVQLDVI